MKTIVEEIKKEFSKYNDEKYLVDTGQFEKGVGKGKTYILRTSIVREVSADLFRKIKNLPKQKIFLLCEELLRAGYNSVAFDWAFRLKGQYERRDFFLFEFWLKKYVKDWGSCDDFCTHAFGHFLFTYPDFASRLLSWVRSKNMWLRRASAVILIYSLRRKALFQRAIDIADILLLDEEDLVLKGYGWMLKEASHSYPKEVFQYVLRNKNVMPRTALRYAIEKFPPLWRREAMKKD